MVLSAAYGFVYGGYIRNDSEPGKNIPVFLAKGLPEHYI